MAAFWVGRLLETDRVRVWARDLPEGVPDWRYEFAVPSVRNLHTVSAAVQQAIVAFGRHVRDGTARGERAWNALAFYDSPAAAAWVGAMFRETMGRPVETTLTASRNRWLRVVSWVVGRG